ncbi:methyltransferase domain-containing protein [Candidatus Woesearchaeota archaeon]|nr:MAG: methyltransferase domain-containing protein [Candidatus Woesearchaeota archaeon]
MIYEPAEDSYLLKKHIRKFAKGKVLDMGTGSGILALEALKYTKDVLAVDLNQECVDYVKKKGVNAIQSDLFKNVKGKFDLIIFNPPYLPEDENEDEESKMITTGGKNGYETLERFLKHAKSYLNKDGKILTVVSSLTGNVEQIFKKYKFKFEMIDKENLFFEKLYVYLLGL